MQKIANQDRQTDRQTDRAIVGQTTSTQTIFASRKPLHPCSHMEDRIEHSGIVVLQSPVRTEY